MYDDLYTRATAVLMGRTKEKRFAPFIYEIDDIKKWNDINELRKANPNLGVSVRIDYMLEEISIAEGSLSKRAEFLTKYCNIKQNSSQAWLPAEVIEGAFGDPLSMEDFRETYCVGGIDLSMTTDLTAAVIAIERDHVFHVFAHFWLPANKIEEATARDGLPYELYIQKGLLSVSGDNIVDYKDVYAWFCALIEVWHIYPLQTGYDRYSSQYLVKDMEAYGFHMQDVYQGFNLTPIIHEFEGLIRDGKLRCGDNDLLKAHLYNTAVKQDSESLRSRIVKMDARDHIDGCAALLDAFTARAHDYETIGYQLRNER